MASITFKNVVKTYDNGVTVVPDLNLEKDLIIFRDSFGSSIAPLLVQGYDTVTLIDVRYISSAMLSRFVEFTDQDVLFLYSTLVLNNGTTLS